MADKILLHNHYYTRDEIDAMFRNCMEEKLADIINDENVKAALSQNLQQIYNEIQEFDSSVSQMIKKSDIVNNINTDSIDKPLSAKQGKNLNERITKIKDNIIKYNGYMTLDLDSKNPNAIDSDGSYCIIRNGWCFFNIYVHFKRDNNNLFGITPPIPVTRLPKEIGPVMDFVEGVAQVTGDGVPGVHSSGRFNATVQIHKMTTTDPLYDSSFPYLMQFFSEVEIASGDLFFGTIAYPIADYNDKLGEN